MEHSSDVGFRQIFVVAEHQHRPLAKGQRANEIPGFVNLRNARQKWRFRCDSPLEQRSPLLGTTQVHDNDSEIGRRFIFLPRRPSEPDKCFLHDLFSHCRRISQQPGQPYHRAALTSIEILDAALRLQHPAPLGVSGD